MKLLDYSYARPDPETIKSEGFSGVLRYLSYNPEKNLSIEERDLLWNAGLGIGLVWETTAQRALSAEVGGVQDATEALKQATELGYTGTIYFAVDFQPDQSDLVYIVYYLNGAKKILGDRVGAYGNYDVVKKCFDDNVVKWCWQTYAWSSGRVDERAQIYQYSNGQWNDSVDFNEAKDNWGGQWKEIMTLQEFITKYDGKFVDVSDNSVQNQCVDLVNAYIMEVLGGEPIYHTDAKDFWTVADDSYQRINPNDYPQAGDIVIFSMGVYGHIAVATGIVNGDKFQTFSQNYPLGDKANLDDYYLTNIIGYLRKGTTMSGFSDEHMKAVLKNGFRQMRQTLLGSVDEVGLENDANFRLSQTQGGNLDPVKDQFNDYMKASNLQWVKKTTCAAQTKAAKEAIYADWKAERVIKDAEISDLKKQLTDCINKPAPECPPCPEPEPCDCTPTEKIVEVCNGQKYGFWEYIGLAFRSIGK